VSAAKKRSVRFTLTFGVDIPDDLAALQEVDPDTLAASRREPAVRAGKCRRDVRVCGAERTP